MLEFIFRWVFRIFVEITVYLMVDHLAYECLRQSCDSHNKKSILLLECIILLPVCAVIRVNHPPYLLFSMTCITLFYALFLPNFRIYWERFLILWSEFLIHEEQERIERGEKGSVSSELLSRIDPAADKAHRPESTQPHGSNGPPAGSGSDGLTTGQRVGANTGTVPQPVNQPFGRDTASNTGDWTNRAGDMQPQPGDANYNNRQPDDTKTDSGNAAAGSNSGPSAGNQAVCGGEGPRNRFVGAASGPGGANSNPGNAEPEKSSKMGILSTFYNMIVPSSSYDGKYPPGITNPSAVCFMNCILQTLSRTPHLVEYINDADEKGVGNALDSQRLNFFREMHAVFRVLAKYDMEADSYGQACFHKAAVETTSLRKAISVLNNLVVDPDSNRKQYQQDAGEFLTWLLDRLDEVLVTSSHIQTTQDSLRRLRDKCNSPSPADIALKRQQCHLQISLANGRDSSTYLWPASVLSDLEWLIYKEPKKSIISDVFQGQEVSALFCDACEHISLSFHQFNVILLPIPTDSDDIIRIEDCFRQAIAVSILSGPNRRQCDFCNSQTQGANPPSRNPIPPAGNINTSTPNGPIARRPDVDFLSPIPRVDHGPAAAPTPCLQRPSLTDGQKQMSYRHLPDCLIVQLLRFDSSMRKILKRVQVSAGPIDLCFLDMLRIGVTAPKLYRLYGVCMHSGALDMESGHYTAFSLAEDGKWYYFNDRKVKMIGNINQELEDEKNQQSVYILFYRRVEHTVR